MKKKFEVRIYYSGFCTYNIEAEDKDEAFEKVSKLGINENEILSNLEEWKEANTVTKIED